MIFPKFKEGDKVIACNTDPPIRERHKREVEIIGVETLIRDAYEAHLGPLYATTLSHDSICTRWSEKFLTLRPESYSRYTKLYLLVVHDIS